MHGSEVVNFIYALIDPRTNAFRYVGKTKADPERRLRQHIQDARRRPREIARFRWINALARIGLQPSLVVLETCGEDWQAAERKWIAKFRASGADLLNGTDGGDGIAGHRMDRSAVEKISAAARARYSDPRRAAELLAMGEKARTPEARAKLSKSLRVTFAKPQVRAKLSAAQKLSTNRPEVKQARSAALKGRVFTDEWKAKISAAKMGKKATAETRAKQSAARTGRTHSEATKNKIRVAALRRYGRDPASVSKD